MKPFNLEEALKGEPVKLRSGEKAFVLGKCNKPMFADEALIGHYVTSCGYECAMTWMITGQIDGEDEQIGDIIGMWEEPPKTIKIGDMDVPEPERKSLKDGENYYVPTFFWNDHTFTLTWKGSTSDFRRLKQGIVHKTKEAAILHAKALLALNKEVVSCADQC